METAVEQEQGQGQQPQPEVGPHPPLGATQSPPPPPGLPWPEQHLEQDDPDPNRNPKTTYRRTAATFATTVPKHQIGWDGQFSWPKMSIRIAPPQYSRPGHRFVEDRAPAIPGRLRPESR